MKYLKTFFVLLFVLIASIFISDPSKYMQSFFDGLTVWAYNVLPALFPFTVFTTLAVKIFPNNKRSLTEMLFGISCDSEFLMSILCGYPIGAKAIADSNADTTTATKMCSFCSSAGPIFMIATIGSRLLRNVNATVILISVHYVSLIINGLIYRNRKEKVLLPLNKSTLHAEDFGNTITNSVLSILSVGGLIALFFMLTQMLKSVFPTAITNNLAFSYAMGVLEMTNGIFSICAATDIASATILCSGLLALGGLCVFLQCYAFLGTKKIKAVDVIKMKLTQSAIATILSFVLIKICL